MSDFALLLTLALAATLAVALAAAVALKAWQGWLELRRLQAAGSRPGARPSGRIDIADLRDRVRRLEAIANEGDGAGRSTV
jgi:hypothetical protein